MEQDDPSISDDVYLLACKLIRYFDTVEQQEPQYVHSRFLIVIIILLWYMCVCDFSFDSKFICVEYYASFGGDSLLYPYSAIRYSRGDFMRGTVLVFLPGLPEIKNMQDILVNNAHYRNLG